MSGIVGERPMEFKPRVGVFGRSALLEKAGQARKRVGRGELVAIREALVELGKQRSVLVAVNAVDDEDRAVCANRSRIDRLGGGALGKDRPTPGSASVEMVVVDRGSEALRIVNAITLHEIDRQRHIVRQLTLHSDSELLRVWNLQMRIQQRAGKRGGLYELEAIEPLRGSCRQKRL